MTILRAPHLSFVRGNGGKGRDGSHTYGLGRIHIRLRHELRFWQMLMLSNAAPVEEMQRQT